MGPKLLKNLVSDAVESLYPENNGAFRTGKVGHQNSPQEMIQRLQVRRQQ
jgi:hypothetical protein